MKHSAIVQNLLNLIPQENTQEAEWDLDSLKEFLYELFDLEFSQGEYGLKIIDANHFLLKVVQKINDSGSLIYKVTTGATVEVDFENKKIINCSPFEVKYEVKNWEQDETESLLMMLSDLNLPDDFPEKITDALNSAEVKSDILKEIESHIFHNTSLTSQVSIFAFRNAIYGSKSELCSFLHLEDFLEDNLSFGPDGTANGRLQLLYGLSKQIWIDGDHVPAGILFKTKVSYKYTPDNGVIFDLDSLKASDKPIIFTEKELVINEDYKTISHISTIFKTNPNEHVKLTQLELKNLNNPEREEAHESFILQCFPGHDSIDPVQELKKLISPELLLKCNAKIAESI